MVVSCSRYQPCALAADNGIVRRGSGQGKGHELERDPREKKWQENAWWVEGKVHDLLALFDYDWKSLSDRLHHGADAQREEPDRVTRQRGDIVKLQYVPSNDGTETLLNQLAKGGPESFSALISYLARERSS
jgi:hypothetical protein